MFKNLFYVQNNSGRNMDHINKAFPTLFLNGKFPIYILLHNRIWHHSKHPLQNINLQSEQQKKSSYTISCLQLGIYTYPKNLRAIIELIFECIIFLHTPFNLFKNKKKRTQELLHRPDKKKRRVWCFLIDDLTTMTHLTGGMQNRCCLEEESQAGVTKAQTASEHSVRS